MENALAKIDGSVLAFILSGIIVGWLVAWLFFRGQNRQTVMQAKAEVDAKAANIDALTHDLAQRDRTVQEQRLALDAFAKERSEYLSAIDQQANDVSDLSAKIELLETSQSRNDDELEVLEGTIVELEKKLAVQENIFNEAINEKHETLNQLVLLKSQLTNKERDFQSSLSAVRNELEEKNAALEQAQSSLAGNKNHSEDDAKHIRRLEDNISELQRIKDQRNGEISNLEASLTVWQQRAVTNESQLDTANSKIHALEKQIQQSANEDPSYKRLLALKDTEIAQHKSQVREAQRALVASKDQLRLKEQLIASLKDHEQKTIKQSRRELSALNSKISSLENTLAMQRREHQQQTDNLRQQQEKLAQQNNIADREITRLNNLIASLENQKRRAEQTIADLNLAIREGQLALHATQKESDSFADQLEEITQRNIEQHHRLDKTLINLAATSSTNEKLRHEIEALKKAIENNQAANNEARPSILFNNPPKEIDDLKRIKGIGPKLESMLNQLGIYQFAQIANFEPTDVAWVDEHIESFKGRIYRDSWIEQAQSLIAV